jgi:general secretion pathway protein E
MRDLIRNHATTGEIEKVAVAAGMTTMLQDGHRKAAAGVTSFDEVLRVTS